jgi:NAD(P)-dependent dehydrogenase (short-subunit alcohol dehydrogenase family)
MGKLTGKIAVVTGAGSGIGAASARALADDGAQVACADINEAAAEATAKDIGAAGGEAFAVEVDVTDPASNADMVAAVKDRYGALHVAHLNAGVATMGSVMDIDVDEWDRVMAINLRGVFLGMKETSRGIADSGGGSIVVTSSGAGLMGGGRMGTYCATKFGVIGLVKCAAVDLAPHNIRVNAVCPGVIDTPILGPIHGNQDMLGLFGQGHPIGRVGQPSEVGRLVAFLASDDASFITGGAYPVDGGITAALGGGAGGADRGIRTITSSS